MYINHICKENEITKGTYLLVCNNKGPLSASFGWMEPMTKWSNYELLILIRYHLRKSPVMWSYKHVKGHQDNNKCFEELTPIEKANAKVDTVN